MPLVIANNAVAKLASNLLISDVSLTVQAGQGSKFPTVVAPDYFYGYLTDASSNKEIVKVTGHAAGTDVFTLERAQEGTAAQAFSAGDAFDLRLTAASLAEFAQRDDLQRNQPAYVGTVGGTGDAITLTPNPAITAYGAGLKLRFVAAASNTGAVTVDVSGLGVKSLTKHDGAALSASDIVSGQLVEIVYDGVAFRLTSSNGSVVNATTATITTVNATTDNVTTANITTLNAGTTNVTGVLSIKPTTNASIELGRIDGVASTPFINFHSGATVTDYDSRIIASDGTGGSGGGTLQVVAATFQHGSNKVDAFPSGTRMLFAQSAAPTGWTQDVTDTANNRMLRVVASAGGGVGGSHDPSVMNVVPSHTHTYSGNTGGESADHAHYVSGNTGGQSANHTHGYTLKYQTHSGAGYPGFDGAGDRYVDAGASTGGTSNDHHHGFAAWTGGRNTGHTHGFSGTTAGNAGASNWTPRYLNLILCTKN